jgi:serine/threonine-protein kinase
MMNASNFSGDNMPKALFGFDVIDFIGEGAGSAIYAVNHPSSGQIYALKYVRPKTDKDQRFIEQLEAEHEVGRLVQYAGLRRTVELMTKKTLLRKVTEAGLLMELFDGIPLERRLPKSMAQTVDVFIQTARALESLHHMGFVHCDLKPNNILVDSGGQVKVIDLGQACKIGTTKSRIQGTPDFIAPEQVKCEAVTVRTDVFNLGATMYWTLSGSKLPTLFTVGKKENSFLLDTRIPTPRDLNAQVPEVLSNVVMECVRSSPARRPAGMMDLARRLEIIQHTVRQPRDPKLSSHGSRTGSMAGAGV